mgnify:CR=1 FL=1
MRAVSTGYFRTSEVSAFEKHVLRCALPHSVLCYHLTYCTLTVCVCLCTGWFLALGSLN